MAKISKISDAAVEKATGRKWAEWTATLDAMGADELPHAAIARLLRERHGMGPWWSQMVAVRYEQLRGLRSAYEKAGGFEVNVSRTVDLPIERVFRAWSDPHQRRRWAPSIELANARFRPNHSIRADGAGGSKLTIRFTERPASRTQVAVEQSRLRAAAEVEPVRTFWRTLLQRLDAPLQV